MLKISTLMAMKKYDEAVEIMDNIKEVSLSIEICRL